MQTRHQRSIVENIRKLEGQGGVVPPYGVLSGTPMGSEVEVGFNGKEVPVRVGKQHSKYTIVGVEPTAARQPTASASAPVPTDRDRELEKWLGAPAVQAPAASAGVIFQAGDGKFYRQVPGQSYIEEIKVVSR